MTYDKLDQELKYLSQYLKRKRYIYIFNLIILLLYSCNLRMLNNFNLFRF